MNMQSHTTGVYHCCMSKIWTPRNRNIKHRFEFRYRIITELVGEVKNSHIPAWAKINDFKWALHLCNQKVRKMWTKLRTQQLTVTMVSHLCPRRYSFWYYWELHLQMSGRQYYSLNRDKRRSILVSQEKNKTSMMSSPFCFNTNLLQMNLYTKN